MPAQPRERQWADQLPASRIAPLALACAACTSIVVDIRTFEGTRWRLTAIDGRATASPDWDFQFGGGRVSGRIGCNLWTGRYSLDGSTMIIDEIVSTTAACPPLPADFGRPALMVLQAPLRLSWRSGTRLTLSNNAGSLALEREQP